MEKVIEQILIETTEFKSITDEEIIEDFNSDLNKCLEGIQDLKDTIEAYDLYNKHSELIPVLTEGIKFTMDFLSKIYKKAVNNK